MPDHDFKAIFDRIPEQTPNEKLLRKNLKEKAPELNAMWKKVNDHWGYEDPIYRFYAQSFKAYRMQDSTTEIVSLLQSLVPDQPFHPTFERIVREGTGKNFSPKDNDHWVESCGPIVTAFLHARWFLDLACRYPDPSPSGLMDSGWAALRILYQIW